jgi:hypothetical protein
VLTASTATASARTSLVQLRRATRWRTIVGGAGVGNTVRVTFAPRGPRSTSTGASTGPGRRGAVDRCRRSQHRGWPADRRQRRRVRDGLHDSPEALTVTFDNATDVASVLFDQRWQPPTTTKFKLIDDQGSQIAAARST